MMNCPIDPLSIEMAVLLAGFGIGAGAFVLMFVTALAIYNRIVYHEPRE